MRRSAEAGEFKVAVGEYELTCVPEGLPKFFDGEAERATLVDRFSLNEPDLCCVSVKRVGGSWPLLVVAQGFERTGAGYEPGVLLVPETQRIFIGAGERLLAYDLAVPRRLWVDTTDIGFFRWAQHGDVVVMSAELELAAWTTAGDKLWTTFAEPPWDYRVEGDTLHLNA